MNIQSILMKMVPVILALVIYFMFIQKFVNGYDDTLDGLDETDSELDAHLRKYFNAHSSIAA